MFYSKPGYSKKNLLSNRCFWQFFGQIILLKTKNIRESEEKQFPMPYFVKKCKSQLQLNPQAERGWPSACSLPSSRHSYSAQIFIRVIKLLLWSIFPGPGGIFRNLENSTYAPKNTVIPVCFVHLLYVKYLYCLFIQKLRKNCIGATEFFNLQPRQRQRQTEISGREYRRVSRCTIASTTVTFFFFFPVVSNHHGQTFPIIQRFDIGGQLCGVVRMRLELDRGILQAAESAWTHPLRPWLL